MHMVIHPYERNRKKEMESTARGENRAIADFYEPRGQIIFNINHVLYLKPEPVADKSIGLSRIVVDLPNLSDIIITNDEANQMAKLLLKGENGEVAENCSYLVAAIRDLWNLLRARMH